MITRQRKRSLLARVMPVLCLAILSYFGYHAFSGELGFFERQRLMQNADRLRVELSTLELHKERLKNRVVLLNQRSIDEDMIDERARYALGLGKENEIVILLK